MTTAKEFVLERYPNASCEKMADNSFAVFNGFGFGKNNIIGRGSIRNSAWANAFQKITAIELENKKMNEREFIRQFTSEYSQLLNNLELADRYNDSLVDQKQLIVHSYIKVLKPLCESYFNKEFPDITVTTKTGLDMQNTPNSMFSWMHWVLKDLNLKNGVDRLICTLIKAV